MADQRGKSSLPATTSQQRCLRVPTFGSAFGRALGPRAGAWELGEAPNANNQRTAVRTGSQPRIPSRRSARPRQPRARSTAAALGRDHSLARASELVRTLERHVAVTLAAILSGLAATLLGEWIAVTVLSAAVAVELVLVAVLLLARQLRAERAWDVIIEGIEAPAADEVVQERRRLSSPGRRQQYARSLIQALDAAEHWHQILVAYRPPQGIRLLNGFAPEIRQVVRQVRDEDTDVAGIALLARFLAGGSGSTLYSADATAIRRELARITHLLSPHAQPDTTANDRGAS